MATTKWALDPSHSEVSFKVKHLMITTVTGHVGTFTAEAEADNENFSNAKVTFSADAASISTGNAQRDGHLQTDDFFNATQYPKLTFKSTGMAKVDDENFKMTGDLTIRDVTKSIELNVEFGGLNNDPYGNRKAGFDITGKINRKDFGLTWGAVTEAGAVVVSDEVKILCSVQMIKQA